MNRGRRPAAKKLDFEPNMAIAQQAAPVIKSEIAENAQKENTGSSKMMGMYAPSTSKKNAKNKKIDVCVHGSVISLPRELEDGTFLVFEDGSFGIRVKNKIYECDSSFIGDGMIVDFEGKMRKKMDVDFILTGYPFEIED